MSYRSRSRSRSRSPRRSSSYKGHVEPACMFVGNLPYHCRERDLHDLFSKCGRLRSVTVGLNRRTGESKGYGFVEFEDRRDAEDAFDKFDNYTFDGRRLRLDWDAGLDKKRDYYKRRSRSRSPRRRSDYRRSPRPSYDRKLRSPERRRTERSPSPSERKRRNRSPSREASPPLKRLGSAESLQENNPTSEEKKRVRSGSQSPSPAEKRAREGSV